MAVVWHRRTTPTLPGVNGRTQIRVFVSFVWLFHWPFSLSLSLALQRNVFRPRRNGETKWDMFCLCYFTRLRQLALDTIDLAKDPYLMRNHLGSYECKLCLTLHNNEGNYLAHTQGRRHQSNLARRAAREARDAPVHAPSVRRIQPRRTVKIGRPGYRYVPKLQPRKKRIPFPLVLLWTKREPDDNHVSTDFPPQYNKAERSRFEAA